MTSIHLYQKCISISIYISNAIHQAINRAVIVGRYRNIELGVICIVMVIDVVPPKDTTKV